MICCCWKAATSLCFHSTVAMICCLPACSMDLLVTSTVACIACFYDTVLMLPWIYCIHAYVLSYASANCMLAYMLLHRGICTFGALFSKAPPAVYFRYTMESHMISCGITGYSRGNHVISCGISGYSTGSHMTPTGKKIIEMIYLP